MSEVDQRPSDIGQTVQPDIRIGSDPEGEEDRTDRRGEDAMGQRDRNHGDVWPQQGEDPDDPTAVLGGPETLDDAGRPA